MRQKTQSYDFDEMSTNSPPWPPLNNLGLNYGDDDRETGSGEWVDKVMVNKLDATNKTENILGCWEADSGNLSEVFYQKYLQDPSKMDPERSHNMFMGGNNQFNVAGSDDMDDLDDTTTDSSEPDLLWQFNHSKLTSIANGNGSKARRPVSKPTNSPVLR